MRQKRLVNMSFDKKLKNARINLVIYPFIW